LLTLYYSCTSTGDISRVRVFTSENLSAVLIESKEW
jgi:hypothetical protein